MNVPSKQLTDKEIRTIKENPYTLHITRERFSLTKEGKARVLELANSGKAIRQIMIEMGYDPDMLGHQRTKNLIRQIRIEAESREGLHSGYAKRLPKRLTREELAELEQNPQSYAKLKAEVIYLREEVEFLKKISQQVISGKRGS